MLKWFAPLLLLAGKPELLIRLVVGALAVAVLLGGVWLISNIALTFDTLKNPYIAAAYGAVLLCFFLVVGMTAWLRLRSLGSTPKATAVKSRAARCRTRSWRNARASFRQNGKQKAGALQRRQTGAFANR